MIYQDRIEAAQLLAQELKKTRHPNGVVLALPRGGVPLGYIIAQQLHLPLDVILIKKIGHPAQPEYAVGAVSLDSRIVNPEIDLPETFYETETRRLRKELQERYEKYKRGTRPIELKGKTVIIVDDGIATGYTMLAAAQLVRHAQPAKLIVAVPVASPRVLEKIGEEADEIVCLQTPRHFQAVGQFYSDFSEVSHEEVVRLLAASEKENQPSRNQDPASDNAQIEEGLAIPLAAAELYGDLHVPAGARGLVIFSHGSGSSRHSSRNRYVARVLEENGFATFLFDLLTEEEDAVYQTRFNIDLLTQRLTYVTQWLQNLPAVRNLPLGFFGASTGAASALGAAANLKEIIKAVVSRGGRPDLALEELPQVRAATLLLVGSLDEPVIGMNEQAYAALTGVRKLVIVPGASHLFEEPGKLEQVANLAADWFLTYLK
ncbi:MAG: phosphoribosyltransferase family protein [Adhaeribacter sp.]